MSPASTAPRHAARRRPRVSVGLAVVPPVLALVGVRSRRRRAEASPRAEPAPSPRPPAATRAVRERTSPPADELRRAALGVAAGLGLVVAGRVAARRFGESSPPPAPVAPPPVPAAAEPDRHADRQAWISWLRFLAIVGVILIHISAPTATKAAAGTSLSNLAIALDYGSRFCVPVFVMVSGALLLDPRRYRGDADFLRRRALRLVPALVFWHAAYLVYRLVVAGDEPTVRETIRQVFTGQLYTALYFFWIILGLAVVTPLLVPWVAAASRRAVFLGAAGLCAIPAVMVATAPLRGTVWDEDFAWTETAVTWFIPYLGFYLLGFALRDVVLRRVWLAVAVTALVAISAELSWQRRATGDVSEWLDRHAPVQAYYGITLVLLAPLVFVVVRALVRPGGLLGLLARRWPARIGAALGGTTLGVFAGHLLVLQAMLELDWIGGDPAATSVPQLLARAGFVVVVTYAGALVVARIPGVRRLV